MQFGVSDYLPDYLGHLSPLQDQVQRATVEQTFSEAVLLFVRGIVCPLGRCFHQDILVGVVDLRL